MRQNAEEQEPDGPAPEINQADFRPVTFLGGSEKDLLRMPEDVQDVFVRAFTVARAGGKSDNAKPLKGYRGAGVLEVVEDYNTDTYRAVYTVIFAKALYILHVFQKKTSKGIKTNKRDLDLIDGRLNAAREHYNANYTNKEPSGKTKAKGGKTPGPRNR